MTGDDQDDDKKSDHVVYDTVQWHNKINMIDPDDGEDCGTCDHCGANGRPNESCYVCRKGDINVNIMLIISV